MGNMKEPASKKAIRGKEWLRSINIPLDKYTKISRAVMKVLSNEPVRFGELTAKVEKEVKGFSGSVGWYLVGTLRELEKEGMVVWTKGSTVTYSKKTRRDGPG